MSERGLLNLGTRGVLVETLTVIEQDGQQLDRAGSAGLPTDCGQSSAGGGIYPPREQSLYADV